MQDFSYKHFIIGGLVLGLIAIGLFAGLRLTQNRQTIKSKAVDQVNAEIISPRSNAKILGTTQVRATAIYGGTELKAVFQIDNKGAQSLDTQSLGEDKFIFTGKFDSSKESPGLHTLKVLLYSLTSPPGLLGSSQIPVTVVTP